jgi:glutathione S-transferase
MTDEEHRAHVEQLPLRKQFYRKMGRTGFSQDEINSALEQLRQTVERMERSFERTQWLASDQFTLADVSIMPTIVRMHDLGLGYLWTDLPAVADWYKRIQSRPAFTRTYPAGSRNIHPSC